MEDTRFDAMARVVGTASRRGMLKIAAGGVLGLVGLSTLTGGVSARVAGGTTIADPTSGA